MTRTWLPFSGPTAANCHKRYMQILRKEGFKIRRNTTDGKLYVAAGQDVSEAWRILFADALGMHPQT